MNLDDRLIGAARALRQELDPTPPELDGLLARRRRGRAIRRGGALFAAVVVVAGITVPLLTSGGGRTTQVSAGPPPPAAAPSDELVVLRAGTIQLVDAATGGVVRTVADTHSAEGPLKGPISVDPKGSVVYATASLSISCPSQIIVAVDLATGARRAVSESAVDPALSPNGTKLAYLSVGGPNCTAGEVVVRDVASGTQQSWPTSLGAAVPAQDATLHWAPDGRRLVIGGRDQANVGAEVLDTMLGPSTDNPHPVGAGALNLLDPALLADGQIATITRPCGDASCPAFPAGSSVSEVTAVDPTTGDGTATLAEAPADSWVSLSALDVDPSGRRIAALAARGDLYTVDDSRLRLVAHNVQAAAWVPGSSKSPSV